MIKPDITFALVQTFHRHGKNHFSSFLPLIADCALQLDVKTYTVLKFPLVF